MDISVNHVSPVPFSGRPAELPRLYYSDNVQENLPGKHGSHLGGMRKSEKNKAEGMPDMDEAIPLLDTRFDEYAVTLWFFMRAFSGNGYHQGR